MYEKRAPSAGTPSVYSHVTTRSSANLRSSKSIRSLKAPWYQKPIIQETYFLDVQRSSLIIAIYSLVSTKIISFETNSNWCNILQLLSIFTVVTACFDLYCYAMAAPGSTHYGYYVISYEFVYVGSRHGKGYKK